MPGAEAATSTGVEGEVMPLAVTTTLTDPAVVPCGRTFHGSCALICVRDPGPTTTNSGAGTPLKVTLTFDSDVESGIVLALAVVLANPVPKIATIDPGATACCGAKLALFTTPFGETETVPLCAAASAAKSKYAVPRRLHPTMGPEYPPPVCLAITNVKIRA